MNSVSFRFFMFQLEKCFMQVLKKFKCNGIFEIDGGLAMYRLIVLGVLLFPVAAVAQTSMQHQMDPQDEMAQHHMMMSNGSASATPTEAGQSAFATIQEIVAILEKDPKTDWTKVNIEALRQHLIDMDNVTLHSEVKSNDVDGGVRFSVSGADIVKSSIRRMIVAHAMTMNGFKGWNFEAQETESGADLIVKVPAKDITKLHALGFIGVMTRGMHHQMHHLALAKGENPHQ